MAQFEPFAPNVEVNGETVLSIVNAFPEYLMSMALKILEDNGISNPVPGQWYSQKAWLGSFHEISKKFGANTLFEIGKVIPANANFPPEIDNLEKALGSIDIAYHMNHQNGDIGYYKLVSFDAAKKEAVMECKNPYPCDFDRGIITTMARKFRPENSNLPTVTLDTSKPSRLDGGNASWYFVRW